MRSPETWSRHRGVALLDALVALSILGTTGMALAALLRQGVNAQVAARAAESRLLAADRVLSAMTLLTRTELDQRLGTHPLGEFAVTIARPEPGLYRLAIADATAPEQALLVTVTHRGGKDSP